MIIYLEKNIIQNNLVKNILLQYKNTDILIIDNYKNIFDRNIFGNVLNSFILASVNNAILTAPTGYGHSGKGYFLKNSLNCIYDCKYCYLKGAFKNEMPVIFINYNHIKQQILENIEIERKNGNNDIIWFYSSDYSDNLAIDDISQFTNFFVPFFDTLENVKMEIRTKSINIKNLLKLKPSKNVEIAFSLNPQEIINKYETKTTSLELRIKTINNLIDKGWQVGIRFLPLLEIENYKLIYEIFLKNIVLKINFDNIYSVFVGGLLYTKDDYNKIIKKEPFLDLLYKLEYDKNGFYREKREVRDFFYKLFDELITKQKCNRCLDY